MIPRGRRLSGAATKQHLAVQQHQLVNDHRNILVILAGIPVRAANLAGRKHFDHRICVRSHFRGVEDADVNGIVVVSWPKCGMVSGT